MFINDVNKKEEIHSIVIQDFRRLGIKYRAKKQRLQETRTGRHVFKTALHLLPMQTVTLISGQQLVIPKVVHELCTFVMNKVDTEGLFRKGGSKSRQNEIKLSLNAGCYLNDDYHEIDIANVLKTFFRELPEPLFPPSYHELFLRCTILHENKLKAILDACLLLPTDHLNTLAYFMQFLYEVTQHAIINKMDANNLSIVIGPTLFPVEEKLSANTSVRLAAICQLCKLLIENASSIGVLSEHIIDRVASSESFADEDNSQKKKKKRRSGSLTRMFSGLKKMVGSRSTDESTNSSIPDLLSTPSLSKSAKKRRIESTAGLSNKKRSDVINNLPQRTPLSTRFTPATTPISVNPNPRDAPAIKSSKKVKDVLKEKKSQWNLGNKLAKNPKQRDEIGRPSGTKAMIERRWSAVSHVAGFRRNKKRNSCVGPLTQIKQDLEMKSADFTPDNSLLNTDINKAEPDYVKISRTEYEAIKSRVSEIERRISVELEQVQASADNDPTPMEEDNGIVQVQQAYEKTLDEAPILSPTTDQLARRLSKELKIRRSNEHKIIRSPSARKIGSLRRRSREAERQLQRTKSWHVEHIQIIPRVNLKRGRPNTVLTGLPVHTPVKAQTPVNANRSSLRAASFHGASTPSSFPRLTRSASHSQDCNGSKSNSLTSEMAWTSAEGFFNRSRDGNSSGVETGRPSLAKLRSQNAGMVLAKAKLFDSLIDLDGSAVSQETTTTAQKKSVQKMVSMRADRASRIRKRGSTPRRRHLRSASHLVACDDGTVAGKENFAKMEIANVSDVSDKGVLKDSNRIGTPEFKKSPGCVTPKTMPRIKKPLSVRSARKLCNTPLSGDSKQTPMKVVPISQRVY